MELSAGIARDPADIREPNGAVLGDTHGFDARADQTVPIGERFPDSLFGRSDMEIQVGKSGVSRHRKDAARSIIDMLSGNVNAELIGTRWQIPETILAGSPAHRCHLARSAWFMK